MFVTGACYVGIHIVLREANLAADLVSPFRIRSYMVDLLTWRMSATSCVDRD